MISHRFYAKVRVAYVSVILFSIAVPGNKDNNSELKTFFEKLWNIQLKEKYQPKKNKYLSLKEKL